MKKIRIYISILLIVSILLTGMLITKNNKAIETSASSNLSNKKIGWGIKRGKDHKRPDVGK